MSLKEALDKVFGDITALYNLERIQEVLGNGGTVVIAPDKDAVDSLGELGVPACAYTGLLDGYLPQEVQEQFKNANVVIVQTDTLYWRKATELFARGIADVGGRVKLLDITEFWRDYPQSFSVKQWIDALNINAEAFYEIAGQLTDIFGTFSDEELVLRENGIAAEPGRFISRYGALHWHELDAPGPEHSFIIDDVFTENDKAVVGGPSQSGKSFLTIDAGMSIALGTDFFGHKVVLPGLVIYQAGEGARGVKKRLRAYRKHNGLTLEDPVPFVLLQNPVDLFHVEADTGPLIEEINSIKKLYPDKPLRMVFIDTLSTASGGADENSGKDMGTVMKNIDRIRSECGCAVCLVHHMNAGGAKLRGHTSIYANADQVILVTRDEETKIRTAVVDKQKDGEGGIGIKFKLRVVELYRRDDGKEITSCVVSPLESAISTSSSNDKKPDDTGFKLSRQEEPIFKALIKALSERGVAPPPELRLPNSVRLVVTYREWKAAYIKVSEIEEADAKKLAEAIKKRMQRAGLALHKFGIIGRDNDTLSEPYIWWTGKPVRGHKAPRQIAPDLPFESDLAPADDILPFK